MTGWISFPGRIVPMEWGRNTYTVLPLPDDVAQALADQGAKRVEVELNDRPVNLALTRAPVMDQVFVYTGKALRKEAGLEPGEVIDVRLRKADPAEVEVPGDVAQALAIAGLTKVWDNLTPGKRRSLLQPVANAKRAETRSARITKLLQGLNDD